MLEPVTFCLQGVPGWHSRSSGLLPAWRRILWPHLGTPCQATERQVPLQPCLSKYSSALLCIIFSALAPIQHPQQHIHSVIACQPSSQQNGAMRCRLAAKTALQVPAPLPTCSTFQCQVLHVRRCCFHCRFRVVAFDQRGHGCTDTGQDEELSADMLVQVHTCTVVVILPDITCGGFGAWHCLNGAHEHT